MADDPVQTGKAALVGELIKAASESPKMKAAGGNLSDVALTITQTIKIALLPLAALNFGVEKAREYFERQFSKDLGEKAAAIPVEAIIEPKASIAGPALQGLAFAHEEPDLKEMYLNLLATSMDARAFTKAHPAFVEIIKQLTAEEADLLKAFLPLDEASTIVEIRVGDTRAQGFNILQTHIMDLRDHKTGERIENPRFAAMVENFIRLGIVQVSYEIFAAAPGAYAWVDERPEYKKFKLLFEDENVKVSFQQGIIRRTKFGIQFAYAVGLFS